MDRNKTQSRLTYQEDTFSQAHFPRPWTFGRWTVPCSLVFPGRTWFSILGSLVTVEPMLTFQIVNYDSTQNWTPRMPVWCMEAHGCNPGGRGRRIVQGWGQPGLQRVSQGYIVRSCLKHLKQNQQIKLKNWKSECGFLTSAFKNLFFFFSLSGHHWLCSHLHCLLFYWTCT